MPEPTVPPPNSVQATSVDQWREWLDRNHQNPEGVWLITFKKGSGKPILSYDDAVSHALCYGWVDSLPRRLDDERTMLYFAPRKAKSGWSKPNKARIAKMEAAGLMTPAGTRKVEEAKADGCWSKLDAVEELEIPPDLAEALAGFPNAAANFEAFPRSVKRGILEWILNGKRAETRAARILETATLAEENKRANQWRS